MCSTRKATDQDRPSGFFRKSICGDAVREADVEAAVGVEILTSHVHAYEVTSRWKP
jgi:hypothetical protein